jgi:UDP-2-acetamido-2,6-beta-L-arabino-hexul-4-ose reductase
MTRVLVTGAEGFLGKNLGVALRRNPDVQVLSYDRQQTAADLDRFCAEADVVYHLAGVNRPERVEEFEEGNVALTGTLVALLVRHGREVPLVLSSSTQAALDNPYGRSKRRAEEIVRKYGRESGAPVLVYRLPGLFGKWSRPNYNAVVSTYCHNLARRLPIAIRDPAHELELAYVDDVVAEMLRALDPARGPPPEPLVEPTFRVTLGELAGRIQAIRDVRDTLTLPDLSDGFTRRLYATFLSYLPEDEFAYQPLVRKDARGSLVEVLKSPPFGQIFVSRSNPGVVRGHHFHDRKVEKFCVVQGRAAICFRHVLGREVIRYEVRGEEMKVVDIPPGYTHSIENLGEGEMVTLFWSSEIFDPSRPDTYPESVQ